MMNFKIMIHSNCYCESKDNQSLKSGNLSVYLLFRKPKTLRLKPPDKIKRVYLNPASY